MKKIFLTVSLFLMTGGLFAQSGFGIRGGLNLATELVSQDNESSTTKLAPSFHLGAYYDARISKGFSIQPGLSLEGKGGNTKIGGESFTDKFLYLQVPINFLGRVSTRTGDFFFGGGPYFAYGIDARVSSRGYSEKLSWGSGANELNPFDFGLGANVGYRFLNGVSLNISNSLGLLNIGNLDNVKYLNQVLSIGVGYEFGKR